MSKPLILLVEDDPAQVRLYRDELADEGYQIEVAYSGEDALEFVKQRTPDAVILDIHMPQMDGLEVLQRLLDLNRRLPVILHTAYSSYQDDLRTWSALHYIIKDPEMDGLKRALRQLLGDDA